MTRQAMSLRRQLSVIALAASLPLIALAIINTVRSTREAVAQAGNQLAYSAGLLAASQARALDATRQLLTAVAQAPGVLNGAATDCQRYFLLLNEQQPGLTHVGVADRDGQLRCVNQPASVADQDFFNAAFKDSLTATGLRVATLAPNPPSGELQVMLTLPVPNPSGDSPALAYASLDMKALADTLAATPLPPHTDLLITDRNGMVLAAHPRTAAIAGQAAPGDAIQRAIARQSDGVSEAVGAAGQPRIVAVALVGNVAQPHFFVAVGTDRATILAAQHADLLEQFLALSLAVLLGAWLAWAIGGRALYRLTQAILRAMRQMKPAPDGGHRGMRLAASRGEVRSTAHNFDDLADALEQREQALQAELGRSQRMQRQLLDAQRIGRIGNWEFDPATQLIEWSAEVYTIFGLDQGAFDGRLETVLQRVHPDDRARYLEMRAQSMQPGQEFNLEHRIVTPHGETRWLHQIGRTQTDAAGRPARRFGVVQEITVRKQAELALTTSGDLLRRTGDMAKIGGWQLDLPGMQVRFSAQILRIHERSSQASFTFTDAVQAYAPGARETFVAAVRAATEHGTPWDMELPMVTAQGRAIWVRTQGEALVEAGRPIALVGALQDITARKEAERAALESNQRYNALFASAPIPMWLFDASTLAFLAVNDAAMQAYGYSEAEFLQMTLFEIRPVSEHEVLHRRLVDGTPLHRSVWTHRRKNGVLFPVNVVSQPVQYAGRAARFSVVMDLTAQRKAEADMQDHLFTLQRAADAASAITYHLTLSNMMQEVAEQSRGVIGTHHALVALAAGAIDSQAIRALSASTSHLAKWEAVDFAAVRQFCAPVFESNRSMRLSEGEIAGSFTSDTPLASRLPHMTGCLAVPLTGRSGDNIGVLLLTDKYDQAAFTQQDEYVLIELARLVSVAMENAQLLDELNQLNVDLEEKVRQRTAALRLSNQELEAFSYSVSHDLRSPLNTIDGFSRLLAKQLTADTGDKARHYLARIHAGVAQMGQLIEDLLSLAQVSRVQLRHEPVDLSLLATEAFANLQAGNPPRKVAVQIESGLQAYGDIRLIRVVMENLVGNAWKFSSLQSHAEISVGHTQNAAGSTVFFVRDNGAGFNMAYADKLYQAFQRLHTVSEFPGTGVGLATVHRIVSRHGGDLWAESKVGEGATFFFTLPRMPTSL